MARETAVPASYGLFIQEGKILLGRRINTGYYDGYYTMPSGHVEAGELPVSAMIREAEEEVGLTLKPEDVELAHVMYRAAHDETGPRADFFFLIRKWEGQPVNRELNKCTHLEFFPLDALPDLMMHHVRFAIGRYQQGVMYSECPYTEAWRNPNK